MGSRANTERRKTTATTNDNTRLRRECVYVNIIVLINGSTRGFARKTEGSEYVFLLKCVFMKEVGCWLTFLHYLWMPMTHCLFMKASLGLAETPWRNSPHGVKTTRVGWHGRYRPSTLGTWGHQHITNPRVKVSHRKSSKMPGRYHQNACFFQPAMLV